MFVTLRNSGDRKFMILQLGLQILLPAYLLVRLWRGKLKSRPEWMLNILAVSAVFLFLFLTARWDFTSYYLRFVPAILLVPAAYRSYRRAGGSPGERRTVRPSVVITSAALFLVFAYLCVNVLMGYFAPEGAIELAYPLRDATYYVGGGGNSRLINNHQAHEPQKFALDIVRLNAFGNRAAGLSPAELDQYAIFEDTVYSPCPGTVIRAVDGLPDLRPPERDNENLAGNHVVLAYNGVEVILAHLRQGSVAVTAGMSVNEGDVLGRVGNSGNTSQPHLHLHAERGGEPEKILNGEGVPIKLGGRFLVRNSLFNGR